MIVGLGTDIVAVDRIAHIYCRFGERFAKRILSQQEHRDFSVSSKPIHLLARRFAAKEALVKALGIGFGPGILHTNMTVAHDRRGKPYFDLVGAALDHIMPSGAMLHVSITDEKSYASAVVILEQP